MLRPISNTPMATPRSLALNHSATAFTPLGMMAASPIASRPRRRHKDLNPVTDPCRISATDHQTTAIPRPKRVPTKSTPRPIKRYMTEYMTRKEFTT